MIEPIAFSFFGLNVYWYGISYMFGFLFSYIFIIKHAKYFNLKKELIEDIFFYVMIFGLIFGRLFHIIFYEPTYYFSHLSQIFAVWKGGMSIHGGATGFLGVLFYYYKKHKIDILKISDLFILPLGFVLAVGRVTNFINQELVGTITNSNLAVIFPKYDLNKRWPTQLFESFKNIVTFEIILFLFYFKKLKKGELTAWFLILYNFGRFIVDFLREADVDLGLISMGQLLSLIFGIFGLFLLFKVRRR